MKTLHALAALCALFALASCAGDSTVQAAPTGWEGTPNPLDLPGGEDPNQGLWRYADPHFRLFAEDFGH